MYSSVYNKIVNYLKENPAVFHSIVTTNTIPKYFNVEVYNFDIYISSPKNTPNPTNVNEKLSKRDFDKLYPLYLNYLKIAQFPDEIDRNAFSMLNKEASSVSGRRIYWIGLFFELKKRNII